MADDEETPAALIVERTEDGETFGVPRRHYADLLNQEGFRDGGSTDLSVGVVPINDALPIPKTERLAEHFQTVGDLRAAVDEAADPVEMLSGLDGVGKKSAQEIVEALEAAQ
jgi:hypothetical protein